MVDAIIPVARLKEVSQVGVLKGTTTLQEMIAEINFRLHREAAVGNTEHKIYFFNGADDNSHELVKTLCLAGYNVQQENGTLVINWG